MATKNQINSIFKYPTADGTASFPLVTDGSGTLSVGAIAAGAMAAMGSSGMSFVGAYTYDVSTASGTVVTTGVGFQPSVIFAIAEIPGTTSASWGFTNLAAQRAIIMRGSGGFTSSAALLYAYVTAGNTASGAVTSFDSDGFTLTWTKTGSPTGTLTYYILAFK